jgi:hypothetical protein
MARTFSNASSLYKQIRVGLLPAKNSAQNENYCRRQQHRNHRQNQIGVAGFRNSVLQPF